MGLKCPLLPSSWRDAWLKTPRLGLMAGEEKKLGCVCPPFIHNTSESTRWEDKGKFSLFCGPLNTSVVLWRHTASKTLLPTNSCVLESPGIKCRKRNLTSAPEESQLLLLQSIPKFYSIAKTIFLITCYHTKPTQKITMIVIVIMPRIFTDFSKKMKSAAQLYREIENITGGGSNIYTYQSKPKQNPELLRNTVGFTLHAVDTITFCHHCCRLLVSRSLGPLCCCTRKLVLVQAILHQGKRKKGKCSIRWMNITVWWYQCPLMWEQSNLNWGCTSNWITC